MKRNKKNALGFLLGLVFAIGFVLEPSVALAKPPRWAPAHGYRAKKHQQHENKRHDYKYIYYPSSQVYYSPVVRKYYYQNNGTWMNGAAAPATVNLGKGISINLGGDTPYVYHPVVQQQYPVLVLPVN